MRPEIAVIATVLACAHLAACQNVDFFYTETIDTCQLNGAYMLADDETTHGGVCAYRQDVERVYACPSPDQSCWTWAQECNDSGVGQTVCNKGGSVFCCNAVAGETCTEQEGQINICISEFASPNSGVSTEQANEVYLAALGVSNVTGTTQTADPTVFSTRNLASTAVSSSSTGASTTTTSGSSTSTSTSSPTGTPAPPSPDPSGISGGAIAGIVVGAAAGLAIIAAIFFFLARKRRSSGHKTESKYTPVTPSEATAYDSSVEKTNAGVHNGSPGQTGMSELGSDGHGRAELSATNTVTPGRNAPTRYETP